jgi:hypothetical protein
MFMKIGQSSAIHDTILPKNMVDTKTLTRFLLRLFITFGFLTG